MKRILKIAMGMTAVMLITQLCRAQQVSSLDLLLHPDEYKAAITGMGGGDLNDLNLQSGQLSAQGAFEMDFAPHKSNKNRHLVCYPLIFRYNLLTVNRIVKSSPFNVRSLAFVENFQTINLGFRVRNLGAAGEDFFLHGPFVDYSYSRFTSDDSLGDISFDNHVVNLGYHICFLMETDAGPLGISLSGQGNYLNVTDNLPLSFQKALLEPQQVASNFAGFSGKALFQFNDFSVFFDVKKYFPVGSSNSIIGLTDKPIISFGGAATGSLFKFRRKESSGNPSNYRYGK